MGEGAGDWYELLVFVGTDLRTWAFFSAGRFPKSAGPKLEGEGFESLRLRAICVSKGGWTGSNHLKECSSVAFQLRVLFAYEEMPLEFLHSSQE